MPGYGGEMDKDTYELVSKHGGKVLNAYCQADDSRLTASHSATRGWCLAMSIHWIAKDKHGGNFFKWMQTDSADASLRFIMNRQQNIVFQAKTQLAAKQSVATEVDRDYKSRSVDALKSQMVASAGSYEAENLASFQIPADCLFDSPGKYCIIHFDKRVGGHTIAAKLATGGGVILMDANVGELSFNRKSGFVGFLNEYGSSPGLAYLPMSKCYVEKYS